MASEYKVGDRVDIEIKGATVTRYFPASNQIELDYGSDEFPGETYVVTDAPGVTVTRIPPQPQAGQVWEHPDVGDVWISQSNGFLWTCPAGATVAHKVDEVDWSGARCVYPPDAVAPDPEVAG